MPQAAGIKLSGTFLSIAGVMFSNIPRQGPKTSPAADAEVRSIDKDQFILTTVCTANRMTWDVILFQFRGVVSAIENLSRERVSGFFVSQIPLFFGFIEETVLRDDEFLCHSARITGRAHGTERILFGEVFQSLSGE